MVIFLINLLIIIYEYNMKQIVKIKIKLYKNRISNENKIDNVFSLLLFV